jgi:hypothetical protein
LAQLRALSAPTWMTRHPGWTIRAAVGNQVKMIPVDEVIYFEATDKYVRVVSAEQRADPYQPAGIDPQLDGRQFWQIHRGTVVQVRQIQAAMREESGKLFVTLARPPGETGGEPPVRPSVQADVAMLPAINGHSNNRDRNKDGSNAAAAGPPAPPRRPTAWQRPRRRQRSA